jgi:hypothetical protein
MPTQNLVQIQRDLQSLPPGPQTMMYLKRAKDGMVATVPPYVAAAELAAREKMAQREALASGAAPGEQPTVSQQLSQKADLLALQAMKKKEMDAQSMNQARTAPGPAPEGAPEPEEQPQPEGGLASLPVDFKFDGGGLVAFQQGGMPMTTGYAPVYQEAREMGIDLSPYDSPEVRKAKLERVARLREARKQMGQAQIPGQAPDVQALAAQMNKPPAPPAPPERTSPMTPQQIEAQVKQPPALPAPPRQGLPAALPQAAAPAAPSPQQTLETALMQRLGLAEDGGRPMPTMAGTGADVKAAQAMFGLDKPAGEEERQLIAEMRARHTQQQKDRARMGLKAVLGGFSQGYGGAAAADVAASQRAYAEDMAQQGEMYKLINAINTGNRKEAQQAVDKTIGLQQQREQDVNAMSRTELQSMTSMYGNLLQAGSSRYNTDMHFKAAMLQAKQAEARGDRADKVASINALRVLQDGQVKQLTALSGELKTAQYGPTRKDVMERYKRAEEQYNETQAMLRKLEGLPETSARAPAPAAPANRPPLTSFQR